MHDATDDQRRAANVALYEAMLDAQNAADRERFLACLAEDVVFDAPYYGRPPTVGRDAMSATFAALVEMFESLSYRITQVIPALDPDLVIAAVSGDNVVRATGKHYCNDYLFLVRCRGGLIAGLHEYSNPLVMREALTPA